MAIDDPTEQSDPDREADDGEQNPEEVIWPEITGRRGGAERLTFTVYNAMLPSPVSPIDHHVLYRNLRAFAEQKFFDHYEMWEQCNKRNPPHLIVNGRPTEIRVDDYIAADLRTSCRAFICEALECHADYLLDCGDAGEKALRCFDEFAATLLNETHEHKWIPGMKALNLRAEDYVEVFLRDAREVTSSVRGRLVPIAWDVERQRTDEELYRSPVEQASQSRGHSAEENFDVDMSGLLPAEGLQVVGPIPDSSGGSRTVATEDRGGAKHVEVARFESLTSRTNARVKIPVSKRKILNTIVPGTAWKDVRMVVSHETLQIEIGGNASELGFFEAGFGKRDQKLELLTYFAASRGLLHTDRFTLPKQSKTPLKSIISRLRRLLQNLIAIDGDPIEHRRKAKMYHCSFQIQTRGDNSFPTPNWATWLDFAFYLRGDGRLRVSVSARHSFQSSGMPGSARAKGEDVRQPESAVSKIYSFEDLGLRTSAGALTREGTALRDLLHSRGKLEADGDDMTVLELARWLRTWTGLDGAPLQFAGNSRLWTSSFECASELNP